MTADAPAFDLQSHSTQSDGSLAPAEVVAAAAAAGVELLALSDHDTVAGVPEALAAAREHGIRLSPAAELSSVHGEHEDLHILGYEIDPSDPGLQAALEDFRADRGRRIMAMADRLRELGFSLDDSSFAARESLGRPHLADAVLAHPDNAERLAREGIKGKRELFPPYLVPGAAAYVARSRPTVEEAIEVIHAAGGVAIWAHPFWDIEDREKVLRHGALLRGARARRRRVLLRRALARADADPARRVRGAGAALDRLGRLPRPRPRPLQPLPQLRAVRPRGAARADRGYVTRSAPV